MRCLYVCLCVCHVVNSVKTNKHIFKFFLPSGSQAILVYGNIPTETPLTGALNAGGIGKNRDSKPIYGFTVWVRAVNAATGQVLSTRRRRTTVLQAVTLIAGSKRRSLLMAGDDNEIFMTRSLNVTPKTTEQHLIAHSDKSVAYVINNKRHCPTFCTIEASYWQTRSIARRLCDSRTTCLNKRCELK